jgi:hypothetical protein
MGWDLFNHIQIINEDIDLYPLVVSCNTHQTAQSRLPRLATPLPDTHHRRRRAQVRPRRRLQW